MCAKRLAHSLASAFVTTLMSGLLWVAQAQVSYLNVSVERDQAHFAIKGEARQVRIEVYSPGGELVFDSGEVAGQAVVWNLLDQQGQPVADGVYLAALNITTGSGEAFKRIEQVTVARGAQLEQQPNGMAPAAPHAPKVEGSGTPGRVPKWTDATQIGDSVINEAANKIGIGQLSPAATLHVTGAQPAALIGNGANATALLQLSGGKGGNTTGGGATAGAGADVSLLAGNGGDAPAGSANGRGGSITLQPGSPGAGGGAAGQTGNLLLAPFGGNVGVGAASPESKLTVDGSIQMTGGGSGLKFPDNTVQTTAAVSGLAAVAHNATLSGDGTGGSPLGVANQAVGNAQLADGAVSGAKIASGQVVKSLNGLTDGLTLAAGSNVTITPSGNTLTIAAAGASNIWSLGGNAGTNANKNFLGTMDNQPLVIKTNNAEALRVNADGTVGIGATGSGAGLTVAGDDLWKSSIGIQNNSSGLEWRLGTDTDGSFILTKLSGATFTPFRAFSNGNVEILTTSLAGSKLMVGGQIENLSGGIKFPDGTIQTTAALGAVSHDATLTGSGASATPLGIAAGGVGTTQLADNAVMNAKIAAGQVVKSLNGKFDDVTLAAGPNITITPSGNTLTLSSASGLSAVTHNSTLTGDGTSASPLGVAPPLSLSGSSATPLISASNSAAGGAGVMGAAANGRGVWGQNTSASRVGDRPGVFGQGNAEDGGQFISAAGNGLFAQGANYGAYVVGANFGVYGETGSGIGVRGIHTATSGESPGVQGETKSTANFAVGVLGSVNSSTAGIGSAGVKGINNSADSKGIGVYGLHASTGTGVYGDTRIGTGVFGIAHEFGFGVVGQSNAGIGVTGSSLTGTAMRADGNSQQSRDKGGWVKALFRYTAAGNSCFRGDVAVNAQLANTCNGFSLVVTPGSVAGDWTITFPFTVNDRFVVVTPQWGGPSPATAAIEFPSASQVRVRTWSLGSSSGLADMAFTVVVF